MKWNSNSGLALFLIVCGALILLSKIGFGIGPVLGYVIPFVVAALGYVGIKNGRTVLGSIVLVIGLIMLVGKFASVIGFILAVGLIIYGFSLLRRKAY
jgi:lia operon protein LiaI